MDRKAALSDLLSPRPLAIILTVALILSIQSHYEYLVVIFVGTLYLIILNSAFNPKKIKTKTEEVLTPDFLLSFAKSLRSSSPEMAFLRALESARPPRLLELVGRIRNGVPLYYALKSIKGTNGAETLFSAVLSDLISLNSEEASNRIYKYANYFEEKKNLRSSLSVKLAVVSLRFRVLSLISSSSLAVIAFASPILYSMAGLSWMGTQSVIYPSFSFDVEIVIPCISAAITSTYTYSKLLPDVDGFKLSISTALVFLITELALMLAIGWHI